MDGATGCWARVNLGHQLAHKLLRLKKQLRIRHGHLERLALGLRLGRRTGTRVDGHRVAAACARRQRSAEGRSGAVALGAVGLAQRVFEPVLWG